MALRRSKPFLAAFPLIDAAIERADTGGVLSRDEFRSARARIVELLCDAADDDEKVERFCEMLDEAMAGSLATLRAVPAEKIELASDDLVGAVGALMKDHPSERVRELARDVVRGWRARVKAELSRAKAAMDVLDGLSSTPPPPVKDNTAPAANSDTMAKKIPEEPPRARKSTVASSCRRISTAESKKGAPIFSSINAKPSASIGAPGVIVPAPPKKTSSAVVSGIAEEQPRARARKTPAINSSHLRTAEFKKGPAPIARASKARPSANKGAPAVILAQPKKTPPVVASTVTEDEKKMEATKRKLHERYQEAEDAKRRRTIKKIEPPRPPPGMKKQGQMQRNAHPARSAAARCFLKSSSLGMRV